MNVCLGANLALDVVERIVLLGGLAHYRVDYDPLKTEHGDRHSDQNIEKFFSSRFACSSSVQGDDEVIIQGDVKVELFDVLPEKWSVIDEDLIDDIGECKR